MASKTRRVNARKITGLTNGTAYEVQVRAGNSAGDGPWSASTSGTPVASASAPSAPSFAARVAPSCGGDVQGTEALWSGGPLSQLGSYGGQAAAGRVDAELGYGLPVGRRFVGTPRVGFGSSAYGRACRFGYRLGALGLEKMDFELGVDGHRRESPRCSTAATFGVLGRASVRW